MEEQYDAVLYLGRAAERSRQLGFKQTEAYQVTNLGRAQCQTGDYDSGAATLQLAIDKAQATGDVRLVAWTPRINDQALKDVSRPFSTRPDGRTMRRSRCSRSMRSPASQPQSATPARPVTCVRRQIGVWKLLPTSSPTATEPTLTG